MTIAHSASLALFALAFLTAASVTVCTIRAAISGEASH